MANAPEHVSALQLGRFQLSWLLIIARSNQLHLPIFHPRPLHPFRDHTVQSFVYNRIMPEAMDSITYMVGSRYGDSNFGWWIRCTAGDVLYIISHVTHPSSICWSSDFKFNQGRCVRQRAHEIQRLPRATHSLIHQKMWEIVKQVVREYDPLSCSVFQSRSNCWWRSVFGWTVAQF